LKYLAYWYYRGEYLFLKGVYIVLERQSARVETLMLNRKKRYLIARYGGKTREVQE
jgi:hypothetical protein